MSKYTILIIEDEGVIAADLQQRLTALGYQVLGIAATGSEVLSLLKKDLPDLILVDIMLKGYIDGIDIALKIKADYNIPVIFLTAYADQRTLERAKLAEPSGYILKPFNEKELKASLEAAINVETFKKKIKEKERWLFNTLQSMGEAVITTDNKKRITFANKVFEEMTGWALDELIAKDITSTLLFINDQTRREVDNPVNHVLATNETLTLPLKTSMLRRDGTEIPIAAIAAPITDEEGITKGAVVVFRDIFEQRKSELELNQFQIQLEDLVEIRTRELTTVNLQLENEIAEHLQTEAALKISAERFRNIFEESPIGIIFFAPDGSFVHMNKASYKIFGLSSTLDLDGYNLLHNSFLTDEQKDKLKNKESIRIERLFDFDFFKHDKIYRVTKTGEVFADILISPLLASEGSEVSGYLAHLQDISERKKYEAALHLHQEHLEELISERTAELADANKHLHIEITERKKSEFSLRESEKKLSTLINNLSGIAYRCKSDDQRTMSYLSDGCLALTGYPIENLIGYRQITINSLIHPDDRERVLSQIQTSILNNVPFQIEYRIITKSGDEKWVLDRGLPLPSETTNETLIDGFIIDITQRIWAEEASKKYSEELKELNQNKDKFFSIIAHDLKSPFQGLLGCSNFLLNEFDSLDLDDKLKLTQDINGAANTLYKLIENLLHWSRMQRSSIEFQTERINLFEEVNYIFKILGNSAGNKEIALINKMNTDVHINADLNMMNSVLQNIVSNAIKFTPSGGTVSVSAETQDSLAVVSITDTGVGLHPDDIQKLFRIDSHFSTKGTNNEEGTGLGLLLCKEMIEKHNCKIWAESKYGEGTSFKFTIPLFPEPN